MARGLIKDESKNLLLSVFHGKFQHTMSRGGERVPVASIVSYLKRRGYLTKSDKKEKTVLCKLTDKGLRTACLLQMKHEHDDQKIWDKQWRIVIFDIPEEHALIRDLFRRFLKQGGFIQLQKSVWITPRAIEKTLKTFIEQLKIEHWVYVIIVKTMTNDDGLKKRFML